MTTHDLAPARPHDLGGRTGGPIDRDEHGLEPWHRLVTAVVGALRDPHKLTKVDELRRAIEDMPPEEYRTLEYFERWATGLATLVVEKGLMTRDEIDRRVAALGEPAMTARFKPGDAVRIHAANPPGHRRVPVYARGRTGVVERLCGEFPNPEELAYGFDGLPKRTLYRVRIRQADLWPDYKGNAKDMLELEIYEHWLDPA